MKKVIILLLSVITLSQSFLYVQADYKPTVENQELIEKFEQIVWAVSLEKLYIIQSRFDVIELIYKDMNPWHVFILEKVRESVAQTIEQKESEPEIQNILEQLFDESDVKDIESINQPVILEDSNSVLKPDWYFDELLPKYSPTNDNPMREFQLRLWNNGNSFEKNDIELENSEPHIYCHADGLTLAWKTLRNGQFRDMKQWEFINIDMVVKPWPNEEPKPFLKTSWIKKVICNMTLNYREEAENNKKTFVVNVEEAEAVNTVNSGINVHLKAFLQGAYDPTTQLMRDDIRSILPLQEPYTDLWYNHIWGWEEIVDPTVFDTVWDDAIVDRIVIELRDENDSTNILETRSALIQKDGDIVDVDWISPVAFPSLQVGGNYYISLYHRNHLSIMTLDPMYLTNDQNDMLLIDFTAWILPLWWINAQKDINDVMVMWWWDANKDQKITYNGAANDKNQILSLVWLMTQDAVIDGYYNEDVTMDGHVMYNGLMNDREFILENIGIDTSNDVIEEQTP